MELLEVYYTSLVIGGVDAEGLTPEDVEPELSSFLEQPASITPQRPRQVSIANIFFIIKFLSV